MRLIPESGTLALRGREQWQRCLLEDMVAVGDAVIQKIFGLLQPADAALLQRRFVDDVDTDHLADELGISRAAVDQRVSRAKARLKAALDAQPELLADLRAGHPHIYPRGRR